MGGGRPVSNIDEMAFDFNGEDYLDPAEEAELERFLDDDDEDDDFDEDIDDEDDWEDDEDWDDDDSDDDW